MVDPAEAFLQSVDHASPPDGAEGLLRAVWHGLRGEWEVAHRLAQDDHTAEGAWVHAWLHRIEGDLDNAAYWYGRARKPRADDSVTLEGQRIARALLAR
jgi:hypothetical protein